MPVAARNAIIIFGLAAVGVVWERAFTLVAVSASQILSVIFILAILAAGIAYFRRNPLAWLVLKPWQRVVVVVAVLAIAFLLIAGYPLLADRVTPLGFFALIQCVIYLLIGNAILGIRDMFLHNLLWMFLTSFVGIAAGLFISSIVSSPKTAINIIPLILIPNIILGGALIKYDEIKPSKIGW